MLPQLVLRQEQFHTSEFLIEAIKRGIPAKEVPVTVAKRPHGHSKKPAVIRYGLGFANAIVRTWLQVAAVRRARPDLDGVRQVEVRPAARADLDVELQDLAAGRAAPLRLLVLRAVEDHRDQAEAAAAPSRSGTR